MESPFFLVQGRDSQPSINRPFLQRRKGYRDVVEYREDLLRKLELVFRIVRKQLIKTREYQNKYYDKKAKLQGFTIGDKVYLHNTANKIGISSKLTKLNWKVPYRVLEKKSDLTYSVQHCGKKWSI